MSCLSKTDIWKKLRKTEIKKSVLQKKEKLPGLRKTNANQNMEEYILRLSIQGRASR